MEFGGAIAGGLHSDGPWQSSEIRKYSDKHRAQTSWVHKSVGRPLVNEVGPAGNRRRFCDHGFDRWGIFSVLEENLGSGCWVCLADGFWIWYAAVRAFLPAGYGIDPMPLIFLKGIDGVFTNLRIFAEAIMALCLKSAGRGFVQPGR